MTADPEAYKQYFDFYLKYYTQKYAKQPPPDKFSSLNTPPQSLPSAFTQLKNVLKPPPVSAPNYRVPPPNFDNTSFTPVVSQSWAPPPIRQQNFNPPQPRVNISAVNRSNIENARKIAEELREESRSGGLGLLAAYDDSDSDDGAE